MRRGRGFGYVDARGKTVSDEKTLERISTIVIPPAWDDVWISPYAIAHIQATGRDARGRLQYRYHPLWAQVRDANKYERTIAFARALPRLRRRVSRDMRQRGLPRTKVVAAAVRLLETALIRVGNEEYARENRSFGVTTLRGRHVLVKGSTLKFTFRGKSGKEHSVGLTDRGLARVVRAAEELPGQRLFQYVDEDGQARGIDSEDVNEYIREVMGEEFSAKDFRTWAGTVLAVRALLAAEEGAPTNSKLTAAVKEVAGHLGNTPAVCRKCYIHPQIVDAYLDGSLAQAAESPSTSVAKGTPSGLRADERLVLSVLRKRVARGRRKSSSIHNVQQRAA